MEEDLETLEDLKNIFVHLKNYGWVNDIKRDVVADKVIKAIENLIARNKELEELLEEKTIRVGFENKEDYIPKSKVREKIKETNKEIKQMEQDDIGIGFTLGNRWSDLKAKVKGWEELLQEGDK